MNTMQLSYSEWEMAKETGYTPITTFWQDFSIAERFGIDSVKDTYRRVKQEWSSNYKYWTELVLVLNHKIWYWYEINSASQLARVYNELWQDADELAMNWQGEALTYFLQTTD